MHSRLDSSSIPGMIDTSSATSPSTPPRQARAAFNHSWIVPQWVCMLWWTSGSWAHSRGATSFGSGPSGRSRLSASECARSVLRTRVRCPSSAARAAVAAAMDILPTPAFAGIHDDAHALRYTRTHCLDWLRTIQQANWGVFRNGMPDKRSGVRSVVAHRWALARSVPAFYSVFSLYAAAAAFLLLLGLGSALAAASPAILEVFQDAAVGGSRFAPTWRIVVHSAPLSEAPGQVLLDYLLSGVNLGLGVFLVWRRPLDGVARLLGLAMVGTAASFNLQAHTAFATVDTVAPEF